MKFKYCLLVLTVFHMSLFVRAQDNLEYKDLIKYGKFGLFVGPAIYQKADVNHNFGKYSVEPKIATSFNAGFDYDFYPDQLWSFQIGFFLGYEPGDYTDIKLPANEVFENSNEEIFKNREKAHYSLSVPMTIRIQKRLGSNLYGQLKGGVRIMNFKQGVTSSLITYHVGEDDSEGIDVFYMETSTPETNYYGSFLIGGGVSWATKLFLLRSNIMYVVNSQPILTGNYQFVNMVSGESGGEIKLSGNYFALWLTFHLKRNKE